MSDPDEPSSNRFTQKQQLPAEWDKSATHVGSEAAVAAAPERTSSNQSSSSSSSNSSNSASNGNTKNNDRAQNVVEHDRESAKQRIKRKLKRLQRRQRREIKQQQQQQQQPSELSEKSGAAPGAQDMSAPPDDSATIDSNGGDEDFKKRNFIIRFLLVVKEILFASYVNVLLIFVPIGIAVHFAGLSPEIIFAMNAIAIIPLAGLLTYATEVVALSLGDTLGALLNVSFGNAVELIIFIIALVKNEINIVQASLIGSILANLLLILGMAFLFGGLRFQEQLYNSAVTQMSACLLSLAVTSLLLPTAFHSSFSDPSLADNAVLQLSRGTSVILLLVYVLYLLFQLKSHAYMYESTPQHIIDEESRPGVLTEFLNTSSSSSDDGSSDSDSSSDSDESHHTAKVIKRALKGRRRRKSNASATATASIISRKSKQSFMNPGIERPVLVMSPPKKRGDARGSSPNGPASGSVSSIAVASGDEADTDGESDAQQHRSKDIDAGAPTHRDFGAEFPQSVPFKQLKSTPDGFAPGDVSHKSISFDAEQVKRSGKQHYKMEKKAYRKGANKKKQKQVMLQAQADVLQTDGVGLASVEEIKPAPLLSVPSHFAMVRHASSPGENTRRDVNFADGGYDNSSRNSTAGRRPLMPLPIRPQLPKMLSQTVFSREYNAQALTRPSTNAVPRAPYGLRRTSSLPERLNRVNSMVRGRSFPGNANPAASTDVATSEAVGAPEKVDLKHRMSRASAIVLLLVSTALVAVCAEFLVDSINGLVRDSSVTEAFIGLIILPIVGNAAEHVSAVTMAAKNKMDLAIGIAVGSSIQIALFVTPIVVLLGWILERGMSLYFTLFETVSLFASAFIVNFLVLDGRSNYLEGSLLIAAYVIIAVAAFFYPNCDASSGAKCGADMVEHMMRF